MSPHATKDGSTNTAAPRIGNTACGHAGTHSIRKIVFGGIEIEASTCSGCGQKAFRTKGYRWTDDISELIGDKG